MALINAFVLATMWGWYIAPYFSVPSLDMIHAFGLAWIVTYLAAPPSPLPGSKTLKDNFEGVEHPITTIPAMMFVRPFGALLVGWIGTIWL